jgi:hypothetical protein
MDRDNEGHVGFETACLARFRPATWRTRAHPSRLIMKPSRKKSELRPPTLDRPKVKLFVAWYTADDWRKVKEASVDSDRFEPTYAQWQAMAEDAIDDLKAAGIAPEKFWVDAETLLAWCLSCARINDAAARAEFVSVQSARIGASNS